MSELITVFENNWVSLSKKNMDNGSSYVYAREPWCNSNGIAILPYKDGKEFYDVGFFSGKEYLGRFEVCPAHSDKIELCSITGGMDVKLEKPIVTAWRELVEEGGYDVPIENIISLGTVRPSKASDKTVHLFAVDLEKGFTKVDAVGDGTLGEMGSYCNWVDRGEIMRSKDPLLHSILLRLNF